MWVIVRWIDPDYCDDGFELIVGPFATEAEAMAVAQNYPPNPEIVELTPPG